MIPIIGSKWLPCKHTKTKARTHGAYVGCDVCKQRWRVELTLSEHWGQRLGLDTVGVLSFVPVRKRT